MRIEKPRLAAHSIAAALAGCAGTPLTSDDQAEKAFYRLQECQQLQERLAFTQEKNWGYRLRQGLVEISEADMTLIAETMFTAVAPLHRLAA